MNEKYVCVQALCEYCRRSRWKKTQSQVTCNHLVVGGVGNARVTQHQAGFAICLSVVKCSVKVCFSSHASLIRLSYSASIEVSVSFPRHNILKVISSHPCLAQRKCFLSACCWRGEVQAVFCGDCEVDENRTVMSHQEGLHGEYVLCDEP